MNREAGNHGPPPNYLVGGARATPEVERVASSASTMRVRTWLI